MKKIASMIVATTLLAGATCTANTEGLVSEPRKVTDYLFEVTCDDYEQYLDEVNQFFTCYNPKLGGCSSVQNGIYRGRNYDWTYDEEP